MKQSLKIGITVLVVAVLAMSGIAWAQTSTTEDTTTPVAVEDTPAYQILQEKLSPLVEDNTISQAQADDVAAALADGMCFGGHRGFRAIAAVADFLEMTPDEMRAALQEYSTIAEIADANGSSGDEVVAYLVDQLSAHLDVAVENGRITEDEKAQKLADAETHLTELVNSEIPDPTDRPFEGRGPGHGGFGGFGGPGPFDGDAGTNA